MREKHAADAASPQNAKARWLTWLLLVVHAFAVIAFVGLIFSRTGEIVTRNAQYEITHITVVNPALRTAMGTAAWIAALSLFVVGIVAKCRRRVRLGTIAIVIALCGYPASYIVSFFLNPAPWTVEDEIVGPDAQVYGFLNYSFLQGKTMALARLDSKGVLRSTFKVLGTNNGDAPQSWAAVIRPAGVRTDRSDQVHISNSGMVLGLRTHECFLAYDVDSGRFYGHGDVEDLSPFILMGAETAMHQPDVGAVAERMRWYTMEFIAKVDDVRHVTKYLTGDTSPGYPREETLTAGLSHANPAVQDVAKNLLDIHRAGIAKARERVGEPAESSTDSVGEQR